MCVVVREYRDEVGVCVVVCVRLRERESVCESKRESV